MSLIDTLKGFGKRRGDADLADEVSYVDAYSVMEEHRDVPDTIQDSSNASTLADDSPSIISEAAPSVMAANFAPARDSLRPTPLVRSGGANLPLIGRWSSDRQQRLLGILLTLGVLGLVLASVLAVRSAGGNASQIGAMGTALMQSQRLAKAVLQTQSGTPGAVAEVRESADLLARSVRDLRDAGAATPVKLDPLLPLVDKAEKNAAVIGSQEAWLTPFGQGLVAINREAPGWLGTAEVIATFKQQQESPAAEVAAAARLGYLLQRVVKTANDALSTQGASASALAQIDKDLESLRALGQGLLDGGAEPKLAAARDATLRDQLAVVLKAQQALRTQLTPLTTHLPALAAVREAQQALLADSEPLRLGLVDAGGGFSVVGGLGWSSLLLLGASLLLGVIGGIGLLMVFTHEQRQRAAIADTQRHEAERQEREAKRVNDANQAAILRLMNELQSVAEGDLTQQATVTEDITGAIADSVNYTVEELRSLVSQVQGTAARVTDTTQQVEATSTELLAASDEQLREIRETGEAVLQMAGRIQQVSGQAQQSADVAHESLTAAASGLTAVQDTISGMNTLREQIQETSKRIKRLGESSQEIGEITELISDITEQTNVLALNAAIQAASAGDAGRGFSVVAEEVQRLAERSGDATRQIAVLVKTIQTDTADAVAAMERSTQGVVEGARLSDNAGTALSEIDRVARRLAELIEEISNQARREADSATVVAQNIQHIFAVTEQTGEGTRSTAQLVRQLSRTAEELRQSVARFKIG